MSGTPLTYTFYCPQGNIGRSMTVLNVAYSLVSKGRSVLLIDLDLQSSAITRFLVKDRELAGTSDNNVINLLRWAIGRSHADPQKTEAGTIPKFDQHAAAFARDEGLKTLQPTIGRLGRLDILTGDPNAGFDDRLAQLDDRWDPQAHTAGVSGTLHNCVTSRRFSSESPSYYGFSRPVQLNYDYILIDCGVADLSITSICLSSLSDCLVLCTTLGDEAIHATGEILDHVWGTDDKVSLSRRIASAGTGDAKKKKKKVLTVVMQMPDEEETDLVEQRLEALRNRVGTIDASIRFHPRDPLQDTLYVRDFPDELVSIDYHYVAEVLMGAAKDVGKPMISAAKAAWPDDNYVEHMKLVSRVLPEAPTEAKQLFKTLTDKYECKTDDEFIATDRACQLLARERDANNLELLLAWGKLLWKWSRRSVDPNLAFMRSESASSCFTKAIDRLKPGKDQAAAYLNRGLVRVSIGNTETAVEDYTAVIQMSEADNQQILDAYYNRGVARMSAGDLDGAISDWRFVIENPNTRVDRRADALFNLGVAKDQMGDAKGAITEWTSVIESAGVPTHSKAAALFYRGLTKDEQEDTEGAVADWTKVIEMEEAPADVRGQALFNRGLAHNDAERFKEAAADWTQLIELPDVPTELMGKAYISRSVVKSGTGDREGALSDLYAVGELKDVPAELRASSLLDLGWGCREMGDMEGALNSWYAVINLRDAPAELKAKAGVARGLANTEAENQLGAIQDFTRVIRQEGVPPEQLEEAYFNRAVVKKDMGDYESALSDWAHIIAMVEVDDSAKARVYNTRGIVLTELGRYEDAVTDFTMVLESAGSSLDEMAEACLNRGLTLVTAGEYEAAEEDFTTILDGEEIAKEIVASARFNRGVARSDVGEIDGAIEDWDALIKDEDANGDLRAKARIRRGIVYERMEEIDNAVDCFRAVIAMDGISVRRHAAAYGQLGRLLMDQEDLSGAEEALRKALGLRAGDSWLQANLALLMLLQGREDESKKFYENVLQNVNSTEELDSLVLIRLNDVVESRDNIGGSSNIVEIVKKRRKELAQVMESQV